MAGLKIMHLSSEKSWRGGEQQIAYLISFLLLERVDVIVCSRKGSAFSEWCKNNGVPYYELGFKNGIDIKTALKIKRIAKKEGVDIVNTHSGKSQSLAYLATNLGMDKPMVVHRRVDFPIKTSGFSLSKYNHRNVKAIVCVSNAIANLVKKAVSKPERVTTVYSGINPERFTHNPATKYLHTEFGIDPSKMLIANISAIAPHKDYETFLHTARLVIDKRTDCHFLAIGDGKLKTEMESLSKNLDLDAHVTFTGFRKDIPLLFREMSVFLITSETEGLGTTVIDALYNGIPVVATDAGGIPELVLDKEVGFLCPVGNAECLAKKVGLLLDSEELRRELGQNAIKRSKLFTNQKMGEGVLQVYLSVMDNLQK